MINKNVDIEADIVLSVNGEDISVDVKNDVITISSPSLRSGIRALKNVYAGRSYFYHTLNISSMFNFFEKQGWMIYADFGRHKLAILGSKKSNKVFNLLLGTGRLVKRIIAV